MMIPRQFNNQLPLLNLFQMKRLQKAKLHLPKITKCKKMEYKMLKMEKLTKKAQTVRVFSK
jgi:hypothetical protein